VATTRTIHVGAATGYSTTQSLNGDINTKIGVLATITADVDDEVREA
jgi:hypothetical protein